ncbi:MAG: NADH-quinone oxidoreductase subunit C [Lachnospiraceae bacterium]|nr:NADH-quinone oxidoreductase subunit C [Lachnospiraceae bacterium]
MNATEGKNEIIRISPAELPIRAMEMKEKGLRLSQACAAWVKKEERLELSYSFVDDTTYDIFNLRIELSDKAAEGETVKEGCGRDAEVASISGIYPYAAFYENEMRELFGANIKVIDPDYHNKLYRIKEETPFVPKKEGEAK